MVPAMTVSAIGLAVLQAQYAKLGPNGWWTVGLAVCMAVYFAYESYDTAGLLSQTRDDMLAACGQNPERPQ